MDSASFALHTATTSEAFGHDLAMLRRLFRLVLLLLVGVVGVSAQKAPPAKPFERFDGCVLTPDEWTDGDSFRVRLPDGRLETFRLYFVDTTESRSRGEISVAFRAKAASGWVANIQSSFTCRLWRPLPSSWRSDSLGRTELRRRCGVTAKQKRTP